MGEYLICKACNYVFEAAKNYEVCPACGVKKAAFEPYKHKVSAKRRKIMDLHIHPIVVHFSEALVVLNVFILFATIFLNSWQEMHDNLMIVFKFNAILLPICSIFTFLSGWYDGKVRFKTVKTPLLMTKIYLSVAHTLLSIVVGWIAFQYQIEGTIFIIALILSIMNMISAAVAGKLGGKLMESKMPG